MIKTSISHWCPIQRTQIDHDSVLSENTVDGILNYYTKVVYSLKKEMLP